MYERQRDPSFEGSETTGSEQTSGTSMGSGSNQWGSRAGSDSGGNVVDMAQQRGGQMADKAKETTSDMLGQAKQQVGSRVAEQKDMAADTLDNLANAVRQTGTQLRDQNQTNIAEYTDRAAEQIERFSGYLRENDPQDMMHRVENFARRQPLAFLGGAALLGFLGARFLKSSSPSDGMQRPYGSSYYQGGYEGYGRPSDPYGYGYGRDRFSAERSWRTGGAVTSPGTGSTSTHDFDTIPQPDHPGDVTRPADLAEDKDEAA